MAERVASADSIYEQLVEKDLLLSSRKEAIIDCHKKLFKLESKANSILFQCRLWVQRAREKDIEIQNLKEQNNKIKLDSKILLDKLKDCQKNANKIQVEMIEMKEHYTTNIAELQNEVIELKQKIDRINKKRICRTATSRYYL